MAHPDTALLDLDGTLVDSNDLHARAWCEALAQHGFAVPFERVRPLIGMGGDKLVPALTELDPESPAGKALSDSRKQLFLERYLPQVQPFACVRELLTRLSDDGYRLVVASSANRDEMVGLLERAGVADLIERETTADDADASKPAPDIVCAALARAGVTSQQAIMLGDTPYDVTAARSAGVALVGLRSGGWDADGLQGAVAVYRDPAELLSRYGDSPFARRAR